MKKILTLLVGCLVSLFAMAEKQVSGVVLDVQDQPVIGASIMVKGSTVGTISDYDGEFFVIDNFNMIETRAEYDSRYCRQMIAKELCKLAHELDVIIIVDAMLFSYYIEEREGIEGKHPSLADLGYHGMSGDLDVFSDVVLGFWSPEKYHIYLNEKGEDLRGILEIEVLKNVNDDNSEGRRISMRINRETLCMENPMKQNDESSSQPKAREPF